MDVSRLKELHEEGLSQQQIATALRVCKTTVRRYLIREKLTDGKYYYTKHKCEFCGQNITDGIKLKFCNDICRNAQRQSVETEKLEAWLAGKITGHSGPAFKVKNFVKRWMVEKYGEKCSLCGWAKKNPTTGKIPVEVDHIDGNAENTTPENLRLLCPNCHSLTPTFRALNKKSARTHWKNKGS